MRLEDYSYHLPQSLIAQTPLDDRSSSRLMVVDRRGITGPVHGAFRGLPDLLDENDLLVINRSRVVPARAFVTRETGGEVEVLFTRERGGCEFEAWVKSVGRLTPGEVLRCEDPRWVFRFVERIGGREGILRAETAAGAGAKIGEVLEALGHVPLPPYIQRPDEPGDRERYQTVYAREKGSVAAPTAGLHFDAGLLAEIGRRGVGIAPLVLHVGPGTFSPLDSDEVEANELDREYFTVPAGTLTAVREAKKSGKRIVAVGTTVTRALESAHAMGWLDEASDGEILSADTNLFIYPGYKFQVVDRLITNFHLPQSSLLLLVCAFLGRERTLDCYRRAVEDKYRFYSYGDAMFIR